MFYAQSTSVAIHQGEFCEWNYNDIYVFCLLLLFFSILSASHLSICSSCTLVLLFSFCFIGKGTRGSWRCYFVILLSVCLDVLCCRPKMQAANMLTFGMGGLGWKVWVNLHVIVIYSYILYWIQWIITWIYIDNWSFKDFSVLFFFFLSYHPLWLGR